MATASRVFWESVLFLLFLAILAGVIFWSGKRVEYRAAELAEKHAQSSSEASERHRKEIETLRQSWMSESDTRAHGQARAVLEAFEAGVHTAAAARWGNYLASAADRLAENPAVAFIHLATPLGRVITSSDDEVAALGRLDEAGEWALGASELISREGTSPGILELALPVVEGGRIVSVLWMGYDLAAVKAAAAEAS